MQLTRKRKTALIAFLAFDALVVIALIVLFQMRGERQRELDLREIGVSIYPEARALSDFRLLDQRGEFFEKTDLEGHWSLMFFGFTRCPDICPFTMAELRQFYAALDFGQDVKPRVFLVTIDPERDNPQSMAAYLADYNEEFIGLSGDPAQIAQLAGELYVGYGESTQSEGAASHEHESSHSGATQESVVGPDDYLLEHSGHIAVINPKGEYYAVMRAPHRDQDLLKAYRWLVR